MSEEANWFRQCADYVLPIALATVGGCVRALNSCEQFSWTKTLVGMVTAGFAGILVYLGLQEVGICETTRAALVGLAGYASGDLLPALGKRLIGYVEKVKRPGNN